MKKYDFPEFLFLYKNYFEQFKYFTPLTVPCCIASFALLIAAECLLFVAKILEALFSFLPSNDDEHIATKVASIIAFSFLYMFKILAQGSINAAIFTIGFLYDKFNLISTLGKGPSAFTNW